MNASHTHKTRFWGSFQKISDDPPTSLHRVSHCEWYGKGLSLFHSIGSEEPSGSSVLVLNSGLYSMKWQEYCYTPPGRDASPTKVPPFFVRWGYPLGSNPMDRSQVAHQCWCLTPVSVAWSDRSIAILPLDGMLVQLTKVPPAFCQVVLTVRWYPVILLGGERHCKNKVSCPRT